MTSSHACRINRRSALTLLGSAAAAVPLASLPGAPAAARAAGTHHTFKMGAAEVTVVTDGTVSLPLSFMLPSTPRADAEALYAANGTTHEALVGQINVTVVRIGDATIVIDSGGADFMPTMGKFGDNLAAAGIAPESVTHVVFTHAHGDHLWGIIDPLEDATRFPKARHLMSAAEVDTWTRPGVENEVPEALKGMAIGTQRRLGQLKDRIETVKPGTEIVPGVAVVDTAGHTPGHISVLVGSGGDRLLVGGDVISNPIVSFARPDWPWGPDWDKDKGAASRKRTLEMLATEKVALLGYHLPWPGLGRVETKDAAFRLVQGG